MFIHHCSIIPDGPSHVQQVGLISFSAEDADSVADAFRDFASMVEGLIREERQRR